MVFSSEKIEILNWPAQSPDLNPIEDALEKRTSKNADELFRNVKVIWKNISVERCHNLVESLRRSCKSVIKAKSFPTKY